MRKITALLLLCFACILVSCENDKEDEIFEKLTSLENTKWESDVKGSDKLPIGIIDFKESKNFEWRVYEYVDGERSTKRFMHSIYTYEYPTIKLGEDITVTITKSNNKFSLDGMVYTLKK